MEKGSVRGGVYRFDVSTLLQKGVGRHSELVQGLGGARELLRSAVNCENERRNWWDLHESGSWGCRTPDSWAPRGPPEMHNSLRTDSSCPLLRKLVLASWHTWTAASSVALEAVIGCSRLDTGTHRSNFVEMSGTMAGGTHAGDTKLLEGTSNKRVLEATRLASALMSRRACVRPKGAVLVTCAELLERRWIQRTA